MQRRKERKGVIETAEDCAFFCDFAALREFFKQFLSGYRACASE